jgi:hypothetical protein
MRPADNINDLIKKLKLKASSGLDRRVHDDISKALAKSDKHALSEVEGIESAVKQPNMRRTIMKSPITKIAAAAVIIIAVLISISQFGVLATSVTWADVAERFDSVEFFNVTIYSGDDTSGETIKTVIWKSENNQVRANEGNKIVFADLADGNNVFVAFDRNTLQPVTDDGITKAVLLGIFCLKGRFSLNNIMNSLPSEIMEITTIETNNNAISGETVIFEAKHRSIPEQRVLVWVLRESRLPFRMHFRSQTQYSDFMFDYSEKKDTAFFDSDAFRKQQVNGPNKQ